MTDKKILLRHRWIKCSCGWKGYPDELECEDANRGTDIYCFDYRCPDCKEVIAYGSSINIYAKAGIEVEVYDH